MTHASGAAQHQQQHQLLANSNYDMNAKISCVCLPACSIKHSDKYSQLILMSPSAADTGPYSCWVIVCDGTECEKDTERAYASYIYFTGE